MYVSSTILFSNHLLVGCCLQIDVIWRFRVCRWRKPKWKDTNFGHHFHFPSSSVSFRFVQNDKWSRHHSAPEKKLVKIKSSPTVKEWFSGVGSQQVFPLKLDWGKATAACLAFNSQANSLAFFSSFPWSENLSFVKIKDKAGPLINYAVLSLYQWRQKMNHIHASKITEMFLQQSIDFNNWVAIFLLQRVWKQNLFSFPRHCVRGELSRDLLVGCVQLTQSHVPINLN